MRDGYPPEDALDDADLAAARWSWDRNRPAGRGAILGAVTSLRSYGDLYDQGVRDELVSTIQDEAERLNRFVTNLLDMTRLEAGVLEPKMAMIDLGEIVAATSAARSRHSISAPPTT